MKKDIYIIRNDINGKVYIGQTFNVAHRWEQYESAFRKKDNKHLISRAMLKYGIEHFHIEVLEKDVENYDEREIYWIKFFNSTVPNGYNVSPGGNGNGSGFENPNAILDKYQVITIKNEIRYSTDSFSKIATRFGVKASMVSSINIGTSYFDKNETYPIRQNRKRREIIKQVIYALKYEHDKSIIQIAKEFGVEQSVVHDINKGELHHIDGETYPLRSGRVFSTLEKFVPEVIDLLINSDLPQKDIARKFNVSVSWVSVINKGMSYRQEGISYPIRKNYQAKNSGRKNRTLTPNEVRETENLLKTTKIGIRKIAEQYEVCYQTVLAMNSGSVVKYRQENSEYPLRKIK